MVPHQPQPSWRVQRPQPGQLSQHSLKSQRQSAQEPAEGPVALPGTQLTLLAHQPQPARSEHVPQLVALAQVFEKHAEGEVMVCAHEEPAPVAGTQLFEPAHQLQRTPLTV